MAKHVVLSDYLAKIADRGIDIEHGDEVFHIPPPELWPASITKASDDEDDAIALIGGQEQYDAFCAASGGNFRTILAIVNEGFDASVPES